jgi:hypothetical protein
MSSSKQVLTGEIPGHVLINLSAEELAPPEMRIKNEQVRERQTGRSNFKGPV